MFEDMVGFLMVAGALWVFFHFVDECKAERRERIAREKQQGANAHPVLTGIASALITWKAFDVWNASRKATAHNRPSGADKCAGRSVAEDLHLD